jgi:transcriptional accessory protein Tex/SPT6
LFSETIAVPTFEFSDVAMCEQRVEDIMSLDHAKKLIVETLKADAGFRDRVANFILYQGVVSNLGDLKNIRKELKTQYQSGYGYCAQVTKQNGHEFPFTSELHGYEYWVG